MMRCKFLLSTIIMLLMCGVFVSFNSIKVEAASSKTLAVNWSNIASVGNQPRGSDACACYSLAYCRTMLDGRVHSWSEYDVNGGNPYNSCASWSKGGYGSTSGVNSAQTAYRACYDSINNNRPAILFVTGSRSTWHYVTVIGYQNVTNVNSLSASNFLIIDSCWFCSKSSAENMAAAGYSAKNDGGYYYHITSSGSVAFYDKNKTVIKNIKVTERTAAGYKVECDIVNDSANQIKSVFFPTWTQKNDQDDLIWHKGTYSNKHAYFYVKSSDHKNETGTYITHIYCCAENSSSFILSSQVGKEEGVGVNLPVSGTVIADASFAKPAAKMDLGDKLSFGGTIRSDINIGKIIIGVYNLDGTAAVENIVQNANSKVYVVNSPDTSIIKKPGEYKVKISASTSKKTTVLLEQSLVVTGEVTTEEKTTEQVTKEEKTTEQKTEQVTKEEKTTEQKTAPVNAVAYNADKALQYARGHWNDGNGLCASFVSRCVQAGGIGIGEEAGTGPCANAICKATGLSMVDLKLDSRGYATSALDGNILSAGDVVLQYCYTHSIGPHILICGGYDSEGVATFYAHNGAMNNSRYNLSYNTAYQHTASCNMGAKVIHLNSISVKDKQGPSYSDYHVGEIRSDGTGFTVMAKVTDSSGISSVKYAVWTEKGGQDDLKWYDGYCTDNNNYYWHRINFSDHNNEKGKYIIHMYAYDNAGNQTAVGITYTFPEKGPDISDIEVSDISAKGYTVKCKLTGTSSGVGISKVLFPTWTSYKGQDDIASNWLNDDSVKGTINNNIATFRVNASEHNNETGDYITHIYAYDVFGNHTAIRVPVVNVHDHVREIIKGKNATCTEKGYTDGEKCSVCGKVLKEQEIIDACGHNYNIKVIEPSFVEKGYTLHKCVICGDEYRDNYVDKLTSQIENDDDTEQISVKEDTKQSLKNEDEVISEQKDNKVKDEATPEQKDNKVKDEATPEQKDNKVKDEATPEQKDNKVEDEATPEQKDNKVKDEATPEQKDNKVKDKVTPEQNDNKNRDNAAKESLNISDNNQPIISNYAVEKYEPSVNNNYVWENVGEDDDIEVEVPIFKRVKNVKKRTMKINISSVMDADGYEYTVAKVNNSTLNKFKKKVRNADDEKISFKGAKTISSKSTTVKLSGLKKNKRYAVAVRAYKIVDGEKYYSDYSSVKSIRIKK